MSDNGVNRIAAVAVWTGLLGFLVTACGRAGTIHPTAEVPVTFLLSVPPALTNEDHSTLAFACEPGPCWFTCTLDHGPRHQCESPFTYDRLGEGLHVFQVSASHELAWTTEGRPAVTAWTVDLTPPETALMDAPRRATSHDGAAFAFSCSEPGCSFECDLDGAQEWQSCPSPYLVSDLMLGDHRLVVRAVDLAGNADPTPTEFTWQVKPWEAVAAGGQHACGLRTGGELWCWGANHHGQLGTGSVSSLSEPPVREATTGTSWSALQAGERHTCARKTNGTLWCWGANADGQIGVTWATAPERLAAPTQVGADNDWSAQFDTGFRHTCARKTNGTLWCWGANDRGQLGTNHTTALDRPTQETSGSNNWSEIAAGGSYTCGIKSDRSLWCWGANDRGQLGDGTTTDKLLPSREASNATDWQTVTTGLHHTCAIKTNRTLWCWGCSSYGALGADVPDLANVPVQEADGATDWLAVTAGDHTTCAVRSSMNESTLWCWGRNDYGQRGNGTTVNGSAAEQEGTAAKDWVAVRLRFFTSCGLRQDGTLWCWGANDGRQISDGADMFHANPFQVE